MSERTILVTGVNGQVGYELVRSLQGLGKIVGLDRSALDLSNPDQIREVVRRVAPTLIVNPAAYTAVDKAETEKELAHQINGIAPGILAEEAKRLGAPMIHYSTDYVYKGDKDGIYVEDDPTDPQNVYGHSKLAGEHAIQASGCAHLILRTSWVYGTQGANFVKTMLRLGAEREVLRVVGDQHGAPTWARTIANITAHIVAQGVGQASNGREAEAQWWDAKSGIYHLTGGGATTWAGFAEEIFRLKGINCKVEPIPAAEYPTPAKRPSNSQLSNGKLEKIFGVVASDWRASLVNCLMA
jgi:dTDP-4-dehydrorhamnose reductase